MGHASYSVENRSTSGRTDFYASASVADTFVQQREGKAHKDMNPNGVAFREARDSDAHPNSTPIQVYLDVTGSMLSIPQELIKNGLPTLMSKLIQNGVPDAALLFAAIGDHECDSSPLQVGQFESGDEELDHWLTRTYLEAGGGGNMGESYALAWYFAANHIETDAWDKRKQKGIVITIGDEPFLPTYPAGAFRAIMGSTSKIDQGSVTAAELYQAATERNHVYHIHVNHQSRRAQYEAGWRQLLGDNLVTVDDFNEVPNVIAKLVLNACCGEQVVTTEGEVVDEKKDEPSNPKITL